MLIIFLSSSFIKKKKNLKNYIYIIINTLTLNMLYIIRENLFKLICVLYIKY